MWVGVLLVKWLAHPTLIAIVIVLLITGAGQVLARHDHIDVRTLLDTHKQVDTSNKYKAPWHEMQSGGVPCPRGLSLVCALCVCARVSVCLCR